MKPRQLEQSGLSERSHARTFCGAQAYAALYGEKEEHGHKVVEPVVGNRSAGLHDLL
jgi:hypothetical protein